MRDCRKMRKWLGPTTATKPAQFEHLMDARAAGRGVQCTLPSRKDFKQERQ